MTKEEIDILWNKALRQSIEAGEQFTRYRFAELVVAAERNSWPAEMEAMERQVNILTDALAQAKAEEREACAKVCDETLAQHYMKQTIPERDEELFLAACADCAAAIRARGQA